MPQAKSTTKSDSDVSAREQLAQREGGDEPAASNLEQQAKDQERQQREELAAGKTSGADRKAARALQDEAPAAIRAGVARNAPTQGGFMDQMSRRSGEDALEGHFVSIDLNADGVKDAYEQAGLVDDDGEFTHRGDYGVMVTRGATDPDTGIPLEAIVRLRDETNVLLTLPYDACRPAEARGR